MFGSKPSLFLRSLGLGDVYGWVLCQQVSFREVLVWYAPHHRRCYPALFSRLKDDVQQGMTWALKPIMVDNDHPVRTFSSIRLQHNI